MSTGPALSFELPDVVAVSGSSSGLGFELCQLLLGRGVQVVGVDVAPVPPELGTLAGYVHVKGSVADEETWSQVVVEVEARGPKAVGLVTSAAILDVGTVSEATRAQMTRAFDVNVVGTVLAFKALLPVMIAKGGGPVVAVASIDATFAEQQLALYAASKGAVRQLARTVAMDHARDGIRVNVLSPGPMMAGLFKRHLESATHPDRFLATRSARQPTGRILEASAVANAAMFLLSSGASALIGADVVADGGLTTSFDFRTGVEGAAV